MYRNGEKVQLDYILGRKRWRNSFKSCQSYNSFQFTIKEPHKGLSKLTKSKAPGPENIPAMIWKHPIFKNELLTFCNEALNGLLPSAFSKSSMFVTPKKGDLKLPSNYRGITLTAISAKIYNSFLL